MKSFNPPIDMIPFNLSDVPSTAASIAGFDSIRNTFPVVDRRTDRVITYPEAVYDVLSDVVSEYQDWPSDQGFGSSDMTYVCKFYIDRMIDIANLNGYYETRFTPTLTVMAYSEARYHEMTQRMESGI